MHGYQIAKRVRAANHWMVRADGNVIGPVSIELLERGLQGGKIPAGAEMSLAGSRSWRRVAEIFPAPASVPAPAPVPASVSYPEAPMSIPTQGLLAAMFG
jgi:hypothetical protein